MQESIPVITDSGTSPDAAPAGASQPVEPSPAIQSVDELQEDLSFAPDAPESEAPAGADDPASTSMEEAEPKPDSEQANLWDTLQSNFQEEQLSDLAQTLAHEYFRDENGNPSIQSIQGLIDTVTGDPGSVLAGDVLAVVDKIQSGELDPAFFHAEYGEEYSKYRQLQQENYQARRDHEIQGRSQMVQSFAEQQKIGEGVESLLSQFKLIPEQDDTPLFHQYKQSLNSRLASDIAAFTASNPSLNYVNEALAEASQIGGPTVDDLLKNPVFQTSLQRGRFELNEAISKAAAREAYFFHLLRKGLDAHQKGQAATEDPTVNSPKFNA